MKIKGKVHKKKLAQKSKTPRTELRITHKDEELTLRAAGQIVISKIDPELEELANKTVELDGHRIEGTKVFVVKKFTILKEDKD